MTAHNPFHHTDSETLAMLLPSAEIEIMRILWAKGPLKAREVYEYVAIQRQVAPLTVRTTLDRLVDKGLVQRPAQYGSAYTPTVDEREFVLQSVAKLLDRLARDYPSVITQYLDMRRECAAP